MDLYRHYSATVDEDRRASYLACNFKGLDCGAEKASKYVCLQVYGVQRPLPCEMVVSATFPWQDGIP